MKKQPARPAKTEKIDYTLTKAFAKILSSQEAPGALQLLTEILTDKELEYIERRLRIALMLKQGESYTKIQKELQVSAATVAVVAEQMKQSGFQALVNHLHKEISRFRWITNFFSRHNQGLKKSSKQVQ